MSCKNSCNGAGCRKNHKSAGKPQKRAESPGDFCTRRAGAAGSGMNIQRRFVLAPGEGLMFA